MRAGNLCYAFTLKSAELQTLYRGQEGASDRDVSRDGPGLWQGHFWHTSGLPSLNDPPTHA